MDWSRRNASGAIAHPNNQQYLPQATSSTVSTSPHTALVQPSYSIASNNGRHTLLKGLLGANNALVQPSYSIASNNGTHTLLKGLLGANNAEDIAKIQMSALLKTPVQQTTQVSQVQYNSSFNPLQQTSTATNQQSSCNIQNSVPSSYKRQNDQQFVLTNFPPAQLMQNSQQKAQQVQQPQAMSVGQQQAQLMQHSQQLLIVQQQAQPVQQPMPNIQQQSQPMPNIQQQSQSMPNIQQQSQPMPNIQQQSQPMPNIQQQSQPMQQLQQMSVVQQQPQPMQQLQQMSVAQPVQHYDAAGYNTREMQKSQQRRGYSHKRTHQQGRNSYATQRYSQNVPKNYQSMMQQPNSQTTYSVPHGNSGQNVPPYKDLSENNVPVSTSNYQNGQIFSNQMGSSYQTNTLQPQRDINDYVQSPQRQMMPSVHSGFTINSSNVLPSTSVGQMPPSYSQSSTNASNVYNNSINQRLSTPNQNFVGQNVQQPAQSCTVPQDQQSVSLPPPAYGEYAPQDHRVNVQEILKFLKMYRDVKIKYFLINRANKVLRQKMQSSSQDNSGAVKPPLISNLHDILINQNDLISREEVSQNSSMQSQTLSNSGHEIQTPTLYDSLTIPVQNIAQSSNSFPSHVYPTNNSDVLNQRNYTGQMSHGSSANFSSRDMNSGNLRGEAPKEISQVSIANNQYFSSGKPNNGNIPQDGLNINSVESLAQTTPGPESSNPVSNLYANKALTLSSREAIKAALPLWKPVTQNSVQSGYSEPKQPIVDNSLNTINLLEEMVSSSINEPNTITPTQKSEHSAPKGIEPQIAIVSPLVQIKELRQCPKVVSHGEDLAIDGVNGFKENDSLNKLLLPFDSDDSTVNNFQDIRLRSGMVSSSPCGTEVSSSCNVDQASTENPEPVDDGLQISGICTLVEGNTLYDSSIAMMFEGSLESQVGTLLAKTDLKYEDSQCSQENINICGGLQATSNVPPTTEMVAVKSEPQGEIEPHDQQEANVCLEAQPENNLSSSDLFDLETNTVSDQLAELLTEFPFGIKNYISENELKNNERSLGKFAVKAGIPKTSVPFSCESSGSMKDLQVECAMDTSTTKMESPRAEHTDQQCMTESVPTPELPTDDGTVDDCFEICDSPDVNIHMTLLDPDQIKKIFPDDSTKPVAQNEDSVVQSLAKESRTPIEKSDSESVTVPDVVVHCCLFGYLTHTNGNAPKCNCKVKDFSQTKDLTDCFSQPAAVITSDSLAVVPDPSKDSCKPSTGDIERSDGFKTELEAIKPEFLQPVLKRPKLEPIDTGFESKLDQYIVTCSPQQEIQTKVSLPEKNYLDSQSQKGLRKNDTLSNEEILQPKSQLGDENSKKSRDPFLGSKSKHGVHQKLEKLIIKTDFLKNKHTFKIKRKYKDIKMTCGEEDDAKNVQKNNNSTEVGESTFSMNRISGDKANIDKNKSHASTAQLSERSVNKLKLSSSSDRSHSRNQAPSLDKREHRGRKKSRPESHFEKVMNLPTAQEYLKRKRELCDKRSGPREEPPEVRHRFVEKPYGERNGILAKPLRPMSPAKIKTKNTESDTNNQSHRGRPRTSGTYESRHKKHRGPSSSHAKGSFVNKGLDQKRDKIYLTPCDGSRQTSYEGISLTKLQIRCSPAKPEYYERRKSHDSSLHNKPSKSETKKTEAPKMLEFKLCPEFVQNPTTQEREGEPKPAKERSIVGGIKSKKEAWCSGGPGKKKSWMSTNIEDQGHSPSRSTSSFKMNEKNSSRPVQDSQATFNAFKQRYHEQRSKSLDNGL